MTIPRPITRISSPCTRVCLVDPNSGLCEGCGRTRREVARWSRMTEEERQRIMAELGERMRKAFGPRPPETE